MYVCTLPQCQKTTLQNILKIYFLHNMIDNSIEYKCYVTFISQCSISYGDVLY